MIGMMYLVYTAMLALNVQKEVLNAFVLVDEGLTKSIQNFNEKNELTYAAFDMAALQNPVKAGPYLKTAQEVKARTTELIKYIQDLKIKLIRGVDGNEALAVVGDSIYPMLIEAKDNKDIPAQIMVKSDNSGEAKVFRKKMEEYKAFLLSLLKDDAGSVKLAIEKGLSTEDPPPGKDKKTPTWETENFEETPLIGVITIMSGLQANVKNAETDILRYLYASIGATDFKVNKLESVVLPKTSYVLKNGTFSADIFIAATDSTQEPEIYVGAKQRKINPDGTVTWEMVGSAQKLNVSKGRGTYTASASSVGYKTWGGLIKLKSPGGGADLVIPFDNEYQVGEASVVISPTKMNVFYVGVENPVDISVPGVPADKIKATIDNGTISRVGNSFVVKPAQPGRNARISVSAEIDKVVKPMGTMDFRVKNVPDPVAKVGGVKTGAISKESLLAQSGLLADMEGFDFDLKFNITGFKLYIIGSGGYVKESISKNNRFTSEQISILNSVEKGKKIFFSDIRAVGPDGTTRGLNDIVLTVK
jgi:gliding motility-associated protein GldM